MGIFWIIRLSRSIERHSPHPYTHIITHPPKSMAKKNNFAKSKIKSPNASMPPELIITPIAPY